MDFGIFDDDLESIMIVNYNNVNIGYTSNNKNDI